MLAGPCLLQAALRGAQEGVLVHARTSVVIDSQPQGVSSMLALSATCGCDCHEICACENASGKQSVLGCLTHSRMVKPVAFESQSSPACLCDQLSIEAVGQHLMP